MARARATSPWTASAQARYVVVVRGAVCSELGVCGALCVVLARAPAPLLPAP